jgi:hypothetical protein
VDVVRRSVPDLLVVIGATGPLEKTLQARGREADLERSGRFKGYGSEEALPFLYRADRPFVVPALALQKLGLVEIEALAWGTLVLVDVPGWVARSSLSLTLSAASCA